MKNMAGSLTALGLATAIVIGQGDRLLHAQNATDPNAAPNPYRMGAARPTELLPFRNKVSTLIENLNTAVGPITDIEPACRIERVFIDKNDTIYVADSQSDDKTNPGFSQGIRIGSVKDGKVTAFIPLRDPAIGSAEELAVDDQGVVYAGFTAQGKMAVRKFVKN